MRLFLAFFALMLICCLYAYASDMALYAGYTSTGWYDEQTMLDDVDEIQANLMGVLDEVVSFQDEELGDFEAWVSINMMDNEMDIIWLNGNMPSFLYPNPNIMPEESLAEEWLDNGNMFINVGDWFAYTTHETGVRGFDNGLAGAQNILDLQNIIVFGDNTSINKMISLLDDDVGMVGARILYPDGERLQHAGVYFSKKYGYMPYHYRHKEKSNGKDRKNKEFQAVTAALALTKAKYYKEVWKKNKSGINGMDELFHWSFEDVDAALAIKYNMGKKIMYCGETIAYHEESASLKKNPVNKMMVSHNVGRFRSKWNGKYKRDD